MACHKEAILRTCITDGLFSYNADTQSITYIGIARTLYPDWVGWDLVDLKLDQLGHDFQSSNSWKTIGKYLKTSNALNESIFSFYKQKIWDPIQGDLIIDQEMANAIFDLASIEGISSAYRNVRFALGKPGTVGENIVQLNNFYLLSPSYIFHIEYLKGKIYRYLKIINRCPVMEKYLFDGVARSFHTIDKVFDLEVASKHIDLFNILKVKEFITIGLDSVTTRKDTETLKNLIKQI